ncbi:MAG: ATP-binding protein [Atopobiaceae bacterium]|jgi:signal transduction histidine kinase/BarA-like signal transduction histidine kinase|nr:ATP-binding protein [Atopobiaceae bacterium]
MGRLSEDKGAAAGVLVLCLLLSCLVTAWYYITLRDQSAQDLRRVQTIYTERTESLVNSVFHKTDVLATVVKLDAGDVSDETFDQVAKTVYAENSGIRGIQLMPGAVVTKSYPLEGNEAVMGKNFLQIPDRAADCQLAIDTRSIALSGPYNLIQGGLGLVARNPVFLVDDAGDEYFWGFSAIVLDLPDALSSAGLGDLPDAGYDFQLFCTNENGERIVIEGDEGLDTSRAVLGTVEVPNHEWTLAVSPKDPWANLLRSLGVLAFCTALSIAVWRQCVMLQREHEATEAKDLFFSDVSHDMRTPLNAIVGFSKLARKPSISAEQRDDYLEKVERSGGLLVDLIDDTLTISRSGQGKIELHPVAHDARTLFSSVCDSVGSMAERGGVSFAADLSRLDDCAIMADGLSVQKVLLNLLSNAVRYTPSGGHVRYVVSSEEAAPSHAAFSVVVSDDGIGMGEEFQRHLYEPFSQEKRSGYESVGTGLGLSIVRQLVDLMGGRISFSSKVGEGTTFALHLSFARAAAASTSPAPAIGDVRGALAGRRALLCEDNELNAEIAVALLADEGVEVVTAKDGKAGVELFSASDVGWFDMVLMDVRMPVMDGLEAARAIRSLRRPDAASVPIVAMTANTFADDVRECLDAGMNAHVAKPIDPVALRSTLAGLVR